MKMSQQQQQEKTTTPTLRNLSGCGQPERVSNNDQLNDVSSSKKQQPEPANSTTPVSNSSTPSIASSNSKSSSNSNSNSNNTSRHTMGRFKEKRPEPLKLQCSEIPLDLSVKSAGNVPSGTFANHFNLSLSNPLATTLETPRIVWQDNESLLTKHRLYSTISNQRLRLQSITGDSPPITPGSPFLDHLIASSGVQMSPSSVCSATSKNSTIFSNHHQTNQLLGASSNSNKFDSVQALISAKRNFNQNQLHQMIEDNFNRKLAQQQQSSSNNNKYAQQSNLSSSSRAQNKNNALSSLFSTERAPIPRRSCSTDDLLNGTNSHLINQLAFKTFRYNQLSNVESGVSKKSSISPLATKNLSSSSTTTSTAAATTSSQNAHNDTRFSYSGHQIAAAAAASEKVNSSNSSPNVLKSRNNLSPVINISGESQSSGDSCYQSINQAMTPSSVANATANLLNIHLNSPTNTPAFIGSGSGPMFSGGTGEFTPTSSTGLPSLGELLSGCPKSSTASEDPLASIGYCQQQSARIVRGSNDNSASLAPNQEKSPTFQQQQQQQQLILHHHLQQMTPTSLTANGLSSLSSSTTLNTPTMISPSHLKTGSICFLPSPTLSPMSSVFELPSPLLMFPPAAQQSASSMGGAAAAGQERTLAGGSPITPPPPTSLATTGASRLLQQNPQSSSSSAAAAAAAATTKLNELNSCNAQPESLSAELGNQRQHSGASAKSLVSGPEKSQNLRANLSEGSLAHLVTSAKDKLGVNDELLDEQADLEFDKMDIDAQGQEFMDCEPSCNPLRVEEVSAKQLPARPATVVPQILVSELENGANSFNYSTWNGAHLNDLQPIVQNRDHSSKRALSQQSFRSRVNLYQGNHHDDGQRLESCSAPPDVYQSRARLKLKMASSESYVSSRAISSSENECSQHCDAAAAAANASQPAPQQIQHQYQPASYQQPFAYSKHANAAPYPSEMHSRWPQHHHHQAEQSWHQQQQQATHQHQHIGGYNFSQSAQQLHAAAARAAASSFGHAQALDSGKRAHLFQQQSASSGELSNFPGSAKLALQPDQLIPNQQQHSTLDNHQLQLRDEQLQQRFLAGSFVVPPPQQQQLRAHSADRARHQQADGCAHLSGEFGFRSSSAAAAPATIGANPTSMAAKKYHCDQCSKAFTRSDMLTRHKRLHSGDRPFQCNECKQEFSRSDHLSTHMRTHTGEKPYKCKLCTYSACRKDMITRHMKVHNRGCPSGTGAQSQRQQHSMESVAR